jgi:ABC-type transport system substrate-binding protein
MGHRTSLCAALVCLLAAAAVFLGGCGAAAPPQPPAPTGTLRWSLEGVSDITRLDPARLGGNQANIPVYLIFGGLVRINDKLEIVGEGAERWQISDDGTVYIFSLRRNLRYGNGDPVTAQQVAASLARAVAPATGTSFALTFLQHVVGAKEVAEGKATSIAGITALNDSTLQITLDSPRGYFLSQLTYGLMFLSPPAIGEGDAWLSQAYGTGPFRVKSREPGRSLVLEGNPFYWAGQPGLAEVHFAFYPTTDAALTAYLAGEVDVMGSQQAGVPAARLGEVSGRPGFQTVNTTVTRYVGMNNALPPFNNVFVRQAFAQAVDKEDLARRVLGGTVSPAERILPRGFPGSEQAIEPLRFDPVGARASLGLAGYVSGNDLPPITLTFDQGDKDLVAVAETLQQGWADTLGVDVRLDPVPVDVLIERLDAMIVNPSDPATAMQLYISVWGADYPDPQNFLSLMLHSGSPYNNGHWSSAEFDTLVDEADRLSAERGQSERYQRYRDAEQLAVREVGWLPLYHPQVTLAIRPTVKGLVPTVTPQGIVAADWTQVRIEQQ